MNFIVLESTFNRYTPLGSSDTSISLEDLTDFTFFPSILKISILSKSFQLERYNLPPVTGFG